MADIFDEVADDLRADSTRQFLVRYAGAFIGAALLVLIAVGAFQGWHWYQHRRDMQAGTQYLTMTSRIDHAKAGLTDAARISDAKALLGFAKTAPGGYASLAQFRAAGLYADAGNLKDAEALWSRLGSSGSHAGPLMRDLATLLWAQHAIGTAPAKTVMARLQPVMNPANPMHDMAQFLGAVADLQTHQEPAAKSLLERVSLDPGTPPGVRNLANGLIAKLNG